MEKRSNFTISDKQLLLRIVGRYSHILENKKTDKVSNNEKLQAWESVALAFNSHQVNAPRTSKQLKTLLENLKRTTRKEAHEEHKSKYLTATEWVDVAKVQLAELAHDKNEQKKVGNQILTIMGDQVKPLNNPYDDAAIYFEDMDSDMLIPSPPEVENISIIPEPHPIRIKKIKKISNEAIQRRIYLKKLQLVTLEIKEKNLDIVLKKEQIELVRLQKQQILNNN